MGRAVLVSAIPPFLLQTGDNPEGLPALIDGLELVVIEGGPHGIAWTHSEQVNDALLRFIGARAAAAAA